MNANFGPEPADADDFATMVAELSKRLDRATLARALGVRPSELDLIVAGHAPEQDASERLRTLYRLGRRVDDLRDADEVLASLGLPSSPRAALSLVPRLKTVLIAFVVLDALVFGGFLVALVLTR